MGSGEKKMAVVLVVVLAALIGVYVMLPKLGVPKNDMPLPPGMTPAGGARAAAGSGGDAACAPGTTTGGEGAKTQEFGKKGAKVEVIALLPITHGCHVNTEAELKKIQQRHPDDIHLTIVDLFGPDAAKYQQQVGGGRTLVSINGRTEFELGGRTVVLERQENGSYQVGDLAPIVEEELKKA